MKKADITDATSQHDSVAIFEYQRGKNGDRRFARLMTSAEYARLTEGVPHYRIHKTTHSVNLVFVQPVDSIGQTETQCKYDGRTFVVAGFADRTFHHGTMLDYQFGASLASIKGQVNRLRSFAEFIISDRAAQKAAADEREQRAKQNACRLRAHEQRLLNMGKRLFALGHAEYRVQNAGWNSIGDTVEIDINTLSALIAQAEKAGA